jgi:hypothetical protein
MGTIQFRQGPQPGQTLKRMATSLWKGLLALVDAFARAFKSSSSQPARRSHPTNSVRCTGCRRFTRTAEVCGTCLLGSCCCAGDCQPQADSPDSNL